MSEATISIRDEDIEHHNKYLELGKQLDKALTEYCEHIGRWRRSRKVALYPGATAYVEFKFRDEGQA